MYSKEFPRIGEQVEELTERLKRERDARIRARLHLLLLVQSGQVANRREAARHLAVHRNSVTNWLRRYEQGGIEALLSIGVGGPAAEQKTLPDEVFRELGKRVAADEFPTYVAAQAWLREHHGFEVSYRTVHSLIRYRLGVKLKRRRSTG